MPKSAQVATEYMVLSAFLLIIIAVGVSIAWITYSEGMRTAQLQNSLVKLRDAANKVYALGIGNTDIVEIILPDGTVSSIIDPINHTIGFTLSSFGTDVDYTIIIDAMPTGSSALPDSAGRYFVRVETVDDSGEAKVEFSEVS